MILSSSSDRNFISLCHFGSRHYSRSPSRDRRRYVSNGMETVVTYTIMIETTTIRVTIIEHVGRNFTLKEEEIHRDEGRNK